MKFYHGYSSISFGIVACFTATIFVQTAFSEILPWWHGIDEDTTTTTVRITTATTQQPVVDPTRTISENCFAQPDCDEQFYKKYPLLEGICNNMVDKNRGRLSAPFKRLLPPDYGDDKGSPRLNSKGKPLTSPRTISLKLSDGRQIQSATVSQFVPFWGQFITHDTVKAQKGKRDDGAFFNCNCKNPDMKGCHNIPVEKTDVRFQKTQETCLEMERSEVIPDVDCDSSIRQQKNEITSFLDAGNIYGESQSDLNNLLNWRSKIGELLVGRHSDKGIDASLPKQTEVNRDFAGRMSCPLLIHKPPTEPCFMAGDKRANENAGLSAIHVLFLRLHNKVVKALSEINPSWDKDTLVKETKAIVTAVLQIITYREFLPTLLGETHMKRFGLNILDHGHWYGYDASKDATISNAFGTAAFRYGHTTVSKRMTRPAPDWFTPEADPIPMKDVFFNSEPLLQRYSGGVNSVLRGLANDASMITGVKMVQDMTELLFSSKDEPGGDLFATNINRGRDHGIPSYTKFRQFCGLKKVTRFEEIDEISSETRVKLASVYDVVDDIDFYIGGLAETPLPGAVVGPTFACIIGYQFRDLRVGDRFWFENAGIFSSFTKAQLKSLRSYSLAHFMCETMSDMRTIQPKPMLLHTFLGNSRKYCQSFAKLDLAPWNVNREEEESNTKESDYEWTAWIPCVSRDGEKISVSLTLNDALIYRPYDVCRDVVNTETRIVNSVTQVRFQCPPGAIKATDFPYIDNGEKVFWTTWIDNSSPGLSGDDDESLQHQKSCSRPIDIQAQTINHIPARETGDVFQSFGIVDGLVCRGTHQYSGSCKDYRVRYLCRIMKDEESYKTVSPKINTATIKPTTEPETTTESDPNKLVWSPWSNTDSPTFDGERELVENIQNVPGFCNQPLYMEARTVGSHLRSGSTGDIFDEFTNRVGLVCINTKQTFGTCQDYEVRYLCFNRDVNKEAPGIPPEVETRTKEYCEKFGLCC